MTIVLEIPGFQGSVFKQAFQVNGDSVNDVLLYSIGEKVEISWSMYAREWNGKWYNNVDLVKIKYQEGEQPKPQQAAPAPAPQPKQGKMDFSQEQLDPDANPDDLPF